MSPPEPPTTIKLTVNITPRVDDALTAIATRTGENKTTAVNRAIPTYDFLTAEIANGAKVVLHYPDGTEQRVQFL